MLNRKKTPKSKVEKIRKEKGEGYIIRDIACRLQCGGTYDVTDLPAHCVAKHGMKPPPPPLSREELQERTNRDLEAVRKWALE